MTGEQRATARARLEAVERAERDLDDERSGLLVELGFVAVDKHGRRWRDPTHGDITTAPAAIDRVKREVAA